jgi:3-dehydroquinate synthetase
MTIQPAPDDSTARAEITVELGNRSYPITIGDGLLAHAGETIKPMLARPLTAIITDENVARHHLATLTAASTQPASATANWSCPPVKRPRASSI